jgi:SAM-dependent methyltransferase
MEDDRRYAPAAARNREAIAAALAGLLPASGLVLEIASGSGEHALHLARTFPALDWQPSDPDAGARASIAAWRDAEGTPNLRPPLDLDAMGRAPFPRADAVLCINMIHIAPWAATLGLLDKAAAALAPGAALLLYGPFLRAGVATAPSNLDFDAALRAENPAWGIRALEQVAAAAAPRFTLDRVVEMPANNLTVAFRRAG